LVVFSIGLLGTVLVNQFEQSFVKQVDTDLRYWSKVVREIFREMDLSLPDTDDKSLAKRMQHAQDKIRDVAVLDQHGKVLKDSQRSDAAGEDYFQFPEIQAAGTAQMIGIDRRHESDFPQRQMMYAARPMDDAKSPVGYVRVGLSLDPIVK